MVADEETQAQANQELRTYFYRIDEDDHIVEVDKAWLEFAKENEAEELDREAVLGKSLWAFIGDVETRLLYQAILERVRQGPMRVSIPFRCDSPRYRRFMQMELVPAGEGHVALHSRLLRREEREPVPLLDPAVERSDEMLIVCGWCKKVELSEVEWVEAEEAVARLDLFGRDRLPRISHGICPSCNETLHSGLQALQTGPASWE